MRSSMQRSARAARWHATLGVAQAEASCRRSHGSTVPYRISDTRRRPPSPASTPGSPPSAPF
eukprot:CAMPEP_0173451704 /NCGR_PEP_ID=MMETSP1357-20121228/47272_1 /TAXON_ID=77926 /ORGANISM="Hemiselmis rufescens, Strain PCC563" /LENGTH=61 /DNA_ID=CAMNT_0014418491 /DNA_START=622 /DNA_END=807 /DNA_ORIENTATION=+